MSPQLSPQLSPQQFLIRHIPAFLALLIIGIIYAVIADRTSSRWLVLGLLVSLILLLLLAIDLVFGRESSLTSPSSDETSEVASRADISVAVAIPGGLITPVIRDAANKSLSKIATEMKDMAARA